MSLVRLADNFGEILYALAINGAFDVTTPLQGMQLEAGARGKCIIIQVTLVDPDIYFGPAPTQEGEIDRDEQGQPT
jgi:hypothetical protein